MDHWQAPAGLRIAYPPGLSPDKWLRRMSERHPSVRVTASLVDVRRATSQGAADLFADDFDLAFIREPASADRSAPAGLARIPLYDEAMAVVVPRDHEASLFVELAPEELAEERWLDPVDPLSSTSVEVATAVELVAANVGIVALPLPLARSFSRRDVVVVPLAVEPQTRMGVCWLPERAEIPGLDEFVGIVRGRTANTSRNESGEAAATDRGRGTGRVSGASGRARTSTPASSGRGRKPGRASRAAPQPKTSRRKRPKRR